MGAWDVGIFDNDLSVDVRAFYEDFLIEDEATATARVLERFAEDVAEPECAPDVWLGLAAAQWEYGRPDPQVLARALAIVEDGSDLERWRLLDADEEDVVARGEALQELAERLRREPPPARLPEPPEPSVVTRFAVGDVLTYELPSGRLVALCVIKALDGAHVCTFMPRTLPAPPTVEEVMAMDIAEDPFEQQPVLVSHEEEWPRPLGAMPDGAMVRAWMLCLPEEEDARVRVLGHVPLAVTVAGHLERLSWRELPEYLERHLGLR